MKDFSMIKKQIFIALCFASSLCEASSAFVPLNLIRPFDPNFFPARWRGQTVQLTVMAAGGVAEHGQNANGTRVNALQTLCATQDALAMLKGFDPLSPQAQLGQQININDDDGTRGQYVVTGDFKVPFDLSLTARFNIKYGFWLGVGIPFYSMKMKNVTWTYQNPVGYTLEDALTNQLLINQFTTNVSNLGQGLYLGDWQDAGCGDTTFMGGWRQHFLQEKAWLKEVIINARIGLVVPTGIRRNEDIAVSLPFGTDGAFALPFGGGLDLRFRKILWAGVDIMFMQIFNHTRDRRIQTDPAQTNLLLLQKTPARIEYGLTQMFNLYIEPTIYKNLSIRVAYEHIKHAYDRVYPISNAYSAIAANTQASLEEWTTHDILVQARYDCAEGKDNDRFRPQISVFGKIPFNGRRSFQVTLVGASLVLNF